MSSHLEDLALFEIEKQAPVSLADHFVVPPISLLDRRMGEWQDRKRRWLSLGIESEVGRGENLVRTLGDVSHPDFYKVKAQQEAIDGVTYTSGEFTAKYGDLLAEQSSGTSVFDPVIAELAYRWYSPVGGTVLDPFAGGSVRGIVASHLHRQYTGIDLRPEQVEANQVQGDSIALPAYPPLWVAGDSRAVLQAGVVGTGYDLVFTCPPYADLEVYSDDPADISNMAYPQFREAYFDIMRLAVGALADDRFAVIVVGEARNKRGNYHGVVPDTIAALEAAGAAFYSHAVIIDPIGSVRFRAGRVMRTSRKISNVCQHFIVGLKGNAKRATAALGDVDTG